MKASDPMTHAKLREAAEALKTNDPTNPAHRLARDLKAGRVSSLEAELSAARAGLLSARQQIGNIVFNLNQPVGSRDVPSIVRSLESVLASTAAITGGE